MASDEMMERWDAALPLSKTGVIWSNRPPKNYEFLAYIKKMSIFAEPLTNQKKYNMSTQNKINWKRVLELIAYVCTALASFVGGATLL